MTPPFIRLAMVLLLAGIAPRVSASDFMFRVAVGDREIEGQPLFWNASQMLVMTRDGRLEEFDPRTADKGKKTGERFVPYSTAEMRRMLLEEFGSGFRVTTSQHYLVVHSSAASGGWADRFEGLYRQFHNYFRVRGFQLDSPQAPLVAVVLPSRDDYFAYARRQGVKVQESMLGHYDPSTNRVLMYDQGDGSSANSETVATIIHEATHQTAYNTGLHSRITTTPRWLVEGLAMMFEVTGVNDYSAGVERGDRVHAGRLSDFRDFVSKQGGEGMLAPLLASDQAFSRDPLDAYAQAWALSFYLSETRPREYEAYLKLTAARPPLTAYTPRQRVDDFVSLIGDDLRQFEAQFLRWMESL